MLQFCVFASVPMRRKFHTQIGYMACMLSLDTTYMRMDGQHAACQTGKYNRLQCRWDFGAWTCRVWTEDRHLGCEGMNTFLSPYLRTLLGFHVSYYVAIRRCWIYCPLSYHGSAAIKLQVQRCDKQVSFQHPIGTRELFSSSIEPFLLLFLLLFFIPSCVFFLSFEIWGSGWMQLNISPPILFPNKIPTFLFLFRAPFLLVNKMDRGAVGWFNTLRDWIRTLSNTFPRFRLVSSVV